MLEADNDLTSGQKYTVQLEEVAGADGAPPSFRASSKNAPELGFELRPSSRAAMLAFSNRLNAFIANGYKLPGARKRAKVA